MSIKIGVMDSGAGGLTILRSIQHAIPHAELLYFADQANAPYGSKSDHFITNRLIAIAKYFREQQCDVMVVACNTATVAGISALRAQLILPIIGVEPAVKPACLNSHRKHISVLATLATSKSQRLNELIENWRFDTSVQVISSPTLASLIDEMPESHEQIEQELDRLSQLIKEHKSDALVLACTHYPLIMEMFSDVLPGIQIVEPSQGVTAQVRRVLSRIKPGSFDNEVIKDQGPVSLLTNGREDFQSCLKFWSTSLTLVKLSYLDI